MISGYAQIITCPHCGAKKKVQGLIPTNTYGQIVWSDNKSTSPTQPRVSFIQECPLCGTFFLMSRQNKKEYDKDSYWENGELSYSQLKKAWKQLSSIPDLAENEILGSLIMLVWAFNDEYTRKTLKDISEEEHNYIISIVKQLLELDNINDLLRAELLREIGQFDEAIEILEAYPIDNEFLRALKKKYRESAKTHNTRPFIIIGKGAFARS